MPELPRFQQVQLRFTAHVRDPERNPPPADVEERRMAIYRQVLFNNVEDFMASSFPVLRAVTPDERWQRLIRDYFARHRARTPLFTEMPREFLRYLEDEFEPEPGDPPWMLQLAHYEWVELALSGAEDPSPPPGLDPDGDLLAGRPVLSPLAWPLACDWPVHLISPEHPSPEARPTFLMVYRDPQGQVHFMELNPATFALIQALGEEGTATGADILRRIAADIAHPDPDQVLAAGAELLADLRRRGVVSGALGPPP